MLNSRKPARRRDKKALPADAARPPFTFPASCESLARRSASSLFLLLPESRCLKGSRLFNTSELRYGAGAGDWLGGSSGALRQPKHSTRVVFEDRCFVGRGQLDLLHGPERNLDVLTPALRVERHVGGEHHAISAEEVEAASQRWHRADRDRVGIELREVVVGVLGQRDRIVPGVRGLEPLVVPLTNAFRSVGRETTEMVRDDLDVRVSVEHAGEDDARHRGHGVVEPSDDAPGVKLARVLSGVVRPIGAANWMQEYRNIERCGAVEQRGDGRVVERPSLDIGIDLDADETQLPNRAIQLTDRGVDVVHRHAGGRAGESVGMACDKFRHFVVGDPRQLQRVSGFGDQLDRRIGDVDDLHVAVAGDVHGSEPGVEVQERRHDAFLILQPHLRGRGFEPRLAVPWCDDMVEDVDFHRER